MYLERTKKHVRNGIQLTQSALKVLGRAKCLYALNIISVVAVLLVTVGYCHFGLRVYIQQVEPGAYTTGMNPNVLAVVLLPVAICVISLILSTAALVQAIITLSALEGHILRPYQAASRLQPRLIVRLAVYNIKHLFSFSWVATALVRSKNQHKSTWRLQHTFVTPVLVESKSSTQIPQAIQTSAQLVQTSVPIILAIELSVWLLGTLYMVALYTITLPFALLHAQKYGMSPQTGALQFIVFFGEILFVYTFFATVMRVAFIALYKQQTSGSTPELFNKTLLKTTMNSAKARKIIE